MNDEYAARQLAIKLRLAGQTVESIGTQLGRSREWVRRWWSRYVLLGPHGLLDQPRTNQRVTRHISPELERTIVTIRQRLAARAAPSTRYQFIGATAILAELQTLHVQPLPCIRTIERVLQRQGLTLPRLHLSRYLPRQVYPGPHAQASNQLHQVDLVGPVYLKGRSQRYYIFVCKDVFDGAICLKLGRSRQMNEVLAFLGDCWKTLGCPTTVQFDNAQEFVGGDRTSRYLSRVIRLCLRFGVEPVFIPPAQPYRNGSVENFNGWFQPVLFQRHFARPGLLKRELQRLQDAVNTQHPQPQLGGVTSAQHRRHQKLQMLPQQFEVPLEQLPIAVGRITFIRTISPHGNLHVLGLSFKVGRRLKGQYVKATLDTKHGTLTVYHEGHVLKRWPYKFLKH
jgi:transposase InsO family protein